MKSIIKTILTITMISQMSFLSINALAAETKPTEKIKFENMYYRKDIGYRYKIPEKK